MRAVSWYELYKTVHVLAIATWFGSGMAIMVIGLRAQALGRGPFSSFAISATWWAGRAHPAAGVLLLITGFAMVANADLSMGELWLTLALIGLVVAFGIGGALTGRTADQLVKRIEAGGGTLAESDQGVADRLLLFTRLELLVLALVIVDMVVKPTT